MKVQEIVFKSAEDPDYRKEIEDVLLPIFTRSANLALRGAHRTDIEISIKNMEISGPMTQESIVRHLYQFDVVMAKGLEEETFKIHLDMSISRRQDAYSRNHVESVLCGVVYHDHRRVYQTSSEGVESPPAPGWHAGVVIVEMASILFGQRQKTIVSCQA